MALEDLTGAGKCVSSLNAAWPVDDDWVDEGDNHIRGIKNVLKNTFPTASVPCPVQWSATLVDVNVAGVLPAQFRKNAVNLGQVQVNGGYSGVASTYGNAPLLVTCGAPYLPALVLYLQGSAAWIVQAHSDTRLYIGEGGGGGPGPLGGFAIIVTKTGEVNARGFYSFPTLLGADVRAIEGALSGVLKLRGVRGVKQETGRAEVGVGVEEVAEVFPELVFEAEGGARGVNYGGLVGPLVEAIRELAGRVEVLEAKRAGS